MQRVTMIALTALGCTAACLPSLTKESTSPVTCYALTLGPWSSRTYGYTVPALIALDTVVVNDSWYRDGKIRRRASPDIVTGYSHRNTPTWIVNDTDTLRIDWSTGFSGFTLALGPEVAGERVGVVEAFSDVRHVPEPPPPRASATARRAECGSSNVPGQ